MRKSLIWMLVGLAGMAIVVGVAAALAYEFAGTGRLEPTNLPRQPVEAILTCRQDPANLPVPTGPEGRPANYLHTCGNRILDSQGRDVRITGVNWSGMEYSGYAPGGLGNRNWQEILDQVASLGYNTIRLPFTNEGLEPTKFVANVNFTLNPDLDGLTGLEMIDRLVAGARERGLKVVLDRHQPTSGTRTNLWYNREVPDERWIADWRMLAARYRGNDTVIAADLHNEPHGEATWGTGDVSTDWRLAAERAGNAVLEENPHLLIFVEGIETYRGANFWWGGNLLGAREHPVRLNVPGRLVYSPHDYGPSVSGQAMFWDSRFPANLPEEWDRHWAYLARENVAPIVVGEFGGWSFGDDPDGKWQRALIEFIRERRLGAIVWSLNPSWDTGGIFANDWQTVDESKQQGYQALLAAPIDLPPSGAFGQARPRSSLRFRQEGAEDRSAEVAFKLRIMNDGPTSLDLSRVEVRYWFTSGDPRAAPERASVEAGELGAFVRTEFVAVGGPNPPAPFPAGEGGEAGPNPPAPFPAGEGGEAGPNPPAPFPTGKGGEAGPNPPAPFPTGEGGEGPPAAGSPLPPGGRGEGGVRPDPPDHYLRITFAPGAQPIEKYRATSALRVWFRKTGDSPPPQSADYSYAGQPPQPGERMIGWDRVTLYVDGQLAGGREP